MSEEPLVEFEFELLETDIRRAFRGMFLRPRKSPRVVWFMWFVGFALPVPYLLLVIFSDTEFHFLVLLITLTFPILWIVGFMCLEYSSSRYLKRTKLNQGITRYRFSSEGFQSKGKFSDSSISWNAYREAYETVREYVLIISDSQFTLIPKRVLPNAEIEELFKQLLIAHIPKVELMSTTKAS